MPRRAETALGVRRGAVPDCRGSHETNTPKGCHMTRWCVSCSECSWIHGVSFPEDSTAKPAPGFLPLRRFTLSSDDPRAPALRNPCGPISVTAFFIFARKGAPRSAPDNPAHKACATGEQSASREPALSFTCLRSVPAPPNGMLPRTGIPVNAVNALNRVNKVMPPRRRSRVRIML